VTIAPKC